jgi:endosialidase-like protein
MNLQRFTQICLATLSMSLLSAVQAVVPPPDGGYPGDNTAEGQDALLSLTGGRFNTANGWLSLRNVTTGQANTAVGAATLAFNTGDSNTAVGAGALLFNTANINTAVGSFALFSNTMGPANTAVGSGALQSNTIGSINTAVGEGALFHNLGGGDNTATGSGALAGNIGGSNNTAIGFQALSSNTGGNGNTAVGINALLNSTSGNGNTALGATAGNGVTTANNVICIGTDGNNIDDSCFIGNIFGSTSGNGVAVLVNSNGRLGTTTSSRRYKQDIRPITKASEVLYALAPVAFRYKKEIDPSGTPQFGLVAEDVAQVNPDLIVRDKKGKPYSVRYDQVNVMLLNEFLKEHQTVQDLKKQVEVLTAGLQKVSAQLELSNREPRTVLNSP